MAAGLADFALDKEYVIGIDGVRDIKIKARPYQKYFWSQSEFDMQRVGVAVELMRKCGLDSGVFREMWAFVYSVGKLIGYIWLEQDRVDPDGLRNGTAGLLGS